MTLVPATTITISGVGSKATGILTFIATTGIVCGAIADKLHMPEQMVDLKAWEVPVSVAPPTRTT